MTAKVIKCEMTDSLLVRRVKRQCKQAAEEEIKRLYRITAGFTDPCPPMEDEAEAMEEGWLER